MIEQDETQSQYESNPDHPKIVIVLLLTIYHDRRAEPFRRCASTVLAV